MYDEDQIKQVQKEVIEPRCKDFATYVSCPARSSLEFPVGRAEGCYLWDERGYQYLDFAGGEGAVLGHRIPMLTAMVNEQLSHYDYVGRYGQHIPLMQVQYAKDLSTRFLEDRGVPKQVLFLNSHLEAMNVAEQLGGERLELLGTRCELIDGGVVQDSFSAIRARGKPVIVDESQTDFGRTGKFLLQEHYGVSADITILGQAGGGGLPFAAVVASKKILAANMWTDPYAGNPVVMALGRTLLSLYTDEVLDYINEQSRIFDEAMTGLIGQFPTIIQGCNGIGLVRQLVLQDRSLNGKFFMGCYEKGLVIQPDLRLTPPMCIGEVEIKRVVDIFADILLSWDIG